jgi:hypothetical protein
MAEIRIAGERLSMTTLSTGQLQSFAAKHTQRGNHRREILLGQAEDGAIGQPCLSRTLSKNP